MKRLLLYLIPIFIFFTAGEIAVRVLENLAKPPPYDTATLDEKIGWRAKANYAFVGKMRDETGASYKLDVSTQADGFRLYPTKVDSNKIQILIVGDSYTQSIEVSDDKTFYTHLSQAMFADIYAYGMAGTGTLQATMLIEEYLPKIQPDLVILQLCSNDFIDNYAPLELESNYKVGLRRPYLDIESNDIKYQIPLENWQQIFYYSKFIRFVMEKTGITANRLPEKERAAYRIAHEGLDYPHFANAVLLTERILTRLKNRMPHETQLLVFSADYYEPQYSITKNMCQKLQIPFLEEAIKQLNSAKQQEKVIYSHDGYHWNEHGHEIVGAALIQDLMKIQEVETQIQK